MGKGMRASLGVLIGLAFVISTVSGCGGGATTTSGTQSGSGSTDITLIAQQLSSFATALQNNDDTTVSSLLSSTFSAAPFGGATLQTFGTSLNKANFVDWSKRGFGGIQERPNQFTAANLRVTAVALSAGSPSVTGDSATVAITSLSIQAGTSEGKTLAGAFTSEQDVNVTYFFESGSISLSKESGTWRITGITWPVMAYAETMKETPPEGGKVWDASLGVIAGGIPATKTDRPTITSSNSGVANTSNWSFDDVDNLWDMDLSASGIVADTSFSASGLKGTVSGATVTFSSFTHTVDVNQ